jgi:hypothetical protein
MGALLVSLSLFVGREIDNDKFMLIFLKKLPFLIIITNGRKNEV